MNEALWGSSNCLDWDRILEKYISVASASDPDASSNVSQFSDPEATVWTVDEFEESDICLMAGGGGGRCRYGFGLGNPRSEECIDEFDDDWEDCEIPADLGEKIEEPTLIKDGCRSSYTSSGVTGRTRELDKALAERGGSKARLRRLSFDSTVIARILAGIGARPEGTLPCIV